MRNQPAFTGSFRTATCFSTIARRVADYQQAHPEADVIRLGDRGCNAGPCARR